MFHTEHSWQIRRVVHIINYGADFKSTMQEKKSLLDAEPEARISPKIRGYICVKSMRKVCILGQVLTTIGGSVQ